VLEGFEYIGIDQDAHYCEIAERRIAHWRKRTAQRGLFSEA
jgi:DNA modification methylase